MTEEKKDIGISVKKENDISEWYSQICLKGGLAEYGAVKGTMVIKPKGYYIWQVIQDYFNKNIVEKTGVKNAYFPLFIPESFFKKEASHAKGFKPEVAWIDREQTGNEERIAIRPTSETIIYDFFSKWIRSYKDLPLKINQWCNIVRWETEATKLFIRSREFLWQEGHCVYETKNECEKESINYIKLYEKLCREILALPVLVGKKTDKEKFAGAETTYTIEAFMPDGKALQCGTSHILSQGFAKAFNINFIGKDEKKHMPWQNSWGLSTRLIGALAMTHSDNKGLILPPILSENKVVIIPILKSEKENEKILKKAKELDLKLKPFNPILDDRMEYTPGFKYNEWELKGIPVRIEIGPKDMEKNQVILVRRDTGKKYGVKIQNIENKINTELKEMHEDMYGKAKKFLDNSIVKVKNFNELIKEIRNKKIVLAPFCGAEECEDEIKSKTQGVTTRCIPFNSNIKKESKCINCGKKAGCEVYFARSY
ncbi:MAG: proline--tRNA ligase [Candidatus Pacearchaeota archaeon]